MLSHVSYENYYEDPISENEAMASDVYIKVWNQGTSVKLKEEVNNGNVFEVFYYLDPSENELDGITYLLNKYGSALQSLQLRKKEDFDFGEKEIRKQYSGVGVFEEYQEVLVKDSLNRIIYKKVESAYNDNLSIELRKYYYDLSNKQYELVYDSAGVLLGMYGPSGSPFVPENDHFIPARDFAIIFPSFLTENPYFSNGSI